jgi:flavin-dependent dehydrogenase
VATSDRLRVDVLIVGGGPAGLSAAIALRREGCTVTVIERMNYRSPRIGEHISPGAKAVLAELGLTDVLSSGHHAACPGLRSVWGGEAPVERDYLFHPNGEGLNLSRPEFDASLAALGERLGATIVTDATMTALSRHSALWCLGIRRRDEAFEVECRVVVDATGRNASIARRLGARPIVYDELIAAVGTGLAPAAQTNLLLIEAVREGWWYSVGLADGSVIATFFSDAELLQAGGAERARIWRHHLDTARMTGARMRVPAEPRNIQVRIARTQRLDKVVGDGWLATGDAAMSFDPLSSNGIHKGLEWGKRVASAATAFCRGDDSIARAYENDAAKGFTRYLIDRWRYYNAERRWPNAPFWSRRHRPPKPLHDEARP